MRQHFWLVAVAVMLSAVTNIFAEDQYDGPPAPRPRAGTVTVKNSVTDRPAAVKARRTAMAVQPTPVPESEVVSSGVPDSFGDPMMTSSGPCYDDCCTPMMACCDPPQDHWIGGVGAYVLKPHWSNGNAAVLTQQGVTFGNTPASYGTAQFSWDYQAAPAAWIGYVNCSGNGVRAGFFQYNQNVTGVSTVAAGQTIRDPSQFGSSSTVGTDFVTAQQLQVSMWDLEALRRGCCCDWSWMATAGVRYLYLNQGYQVDQYSPTGVTQFSANSRRFFNGAGPTLSLQARRQVGQRGAGVYGIGRGSLMFGSQNTSAASPINRRADNEGTFPVSAGTSYWGVIPVMELEVGADYQRPMGNTTLVLKTGLVGLAFIDSGDAQSTSFFSGLGSQNTLGFFGANSSIGLTY